MLNGRKTYIHDGTISVRYLIVGDVINLKGADVKLNRILDDNKTQVMTLTGSYIEENQYKHVEIPVGYGLRLKIDTQFKSAKTVTPEFNSFRYALGTQIPDINRVAFKYMLDMEETLKYIGDSIEDDDGDFESKVYSFHYSDELYTFLTQYAGYSGSALSYDRYQEMAD